MPPALSQQQLNFLKDKSQRKVLLAVAGAGKTTTLKAALQYTTPPVLMIVYNVSLREELQTKFANTSGIEVTNLHSLLYRWFVADFSTEVDVLEHQRFLKIYPDLEKINNSQNELKNAIVTLTKQSPTIISYRILELYLELGLVRREHIADYNTLIIDELQDLRPEILEALLKLFKTKNIIISGDLNQSIYSFNGADPQAISTILRKYDFTIHNLTVSYRVPIALVPIIKKIIQSDFQAAPNNAIGQLKRLTYKSMRQFFRGLFYGLQAITDPEFSLPASDWRAQITSEVLNGKSLAILTRLNNTAIQACKAAQDYGVPIICLPTLARTVSKALDLIQEIYLLNSYGIKLSERNPTKRLTDFMESNINRQIICELAGLSPNKSVDSEAIKQHLLNLTPQEALNKARNLIYRVIRKNPQAIIVGTIHSVKGLEFDTVLIPDLSAGIFPLTGADIEEEKRALYVGVTRARLTLIIAHPQHTPSQFVDYFTSAPPTRTWEDKPIQHKLLPGL